MQDEIDISKHIAIVFLILALAGCGYLYYLRNQDKEKIAQLESQYDELKIKYSAALATSNSAIPTPTTTSTLSNWKNYQNSSYKFSLTFTDAWKGYIAEEEKLTDDKGTHFRFYVPTKDETYISQKQGYADPFVISIYKLSDWETMENQEEIKASVIKKTSSYVYVYSTWQTCPKDLCDTIIPKDIISTFKFTD